MTTTRERPVARTPAEPRLGPLGTARFVWRQLTSMRTALFLLLLLAVAAVPGSVLPQRGVNASQVSAYLDAHPDAGPWLDRLGGFDVYSSVWFSAIYLLLFVSLVGCVLPRSRHHLRAMRARPPRAPSRLDRLPAHRSIELDDDPAAVLHRAGAALRSRRYRVAVTGDPDGPDGQDGQDGGTVSAERGRLREGGNLVFHLALVMLLVAVAAGHLLGWRGDVVVPVGTTFSNTVSAYDTLDPGPWVDTEAFPPFSVDVEAMSVAFEDTGSERGAPRDFRATVTSRTDPQAPGRRSVVSVNHPLQVDGAKVFLLGNGYAPVITVRDGTGQVVYSDSTPFLPQDGNYTSQGVVKAPGAQPQQIGLIGRFLPTAAIDPNRGPISVFPDARKPAIAFTALVGDLGLGSGRPQSVYTLDVDAMKPLTGVGGAQFRALIVPGQTVQLPDGAGSVTFDRVERFAGLSVRHDPARGWALGAAIAAMLGLALSLFVPRRRVFVRVRAGGGGRRTVVDAAALARGEDSGLDDELDRLLSALAIRQPGAEQPGPRTTTDQEARA